jgi:hypothetical protein
MPTTTDPSITTATIDASIIMPTTTDTSIITRAIATWRLGDIKEGPPVWVRSSNEAPRELRMGKPSRTSTGRLSAKRCAFSPRLFRRGAKPGAPFGVARVE